MVVVRDAHRRAAARGEVTTELLAARPDAVVVEMGLPVWRPASGGYVATYGAARPNGRAAAEVLGLTGPPAAIAQAAAPSLAALQVWPAQADPV